MKPTNLQIGDVVKVRQGFKDPDTKVDMSNWHGRITEFYPEVGTALITFDSITLQNLSLDYIDQSDVEGVSWSEYGYNLADLTRVEPRDTTADVEKIIEQIENRYAHNFLYLGEEGREIQRIMQTIDPKGEMGPLDVWAEYLEQKLTFPFEAVSVPDISDYFGVGKSSPAGKSKEIRDLLNIGLMEPERTLPSRMDRNPMACISQLTASSWMPVRLPVTFKRSLFLGVIYPFGACLSPPSSAVVESTPRARYAPLVPVPLQHRKCAPHRLVSRAGCYRHAAGQEDARFQLDMGSVSAL